MGISPYNLVVFMLRYSLLQLDVGNLPIIVANMFGTSVFAGGIFCTLLVWLATAIPLFWVIKDKGAPYTVVVHSILIVAFATGIGWIDAWVLLLVGFGEACAMALLLSERM